MNTDEIIATHMAAAAMLMEDCSAKALLEPLAAERTGDLRSVAAELLAIADLVDAVRRAGDRGIR